MAYVSRVTVHNYKGFRDATFELPQSGLVLVVGANNAGKSAILSALDAVRGLNIPLSSIYADARDARLQVRFELNSEEYEAARMRAEWPTWLHATAIELQLEADLAAQAWDLQEVSVITADGSSVQAVRKVHGSNGETIERLSSAGSREAPSWSSEVFLQGGHAALDLANSPFLSPWFSDWTGDYFHFHALKQQIGTNTQLAATPTLAADGSNLLQVLLHLQHNEQASWAQLHDLVAGVLPDVGELRLPLHDSTGRIAFLDPHLNRQLDLPSLGTGVEQLLMTFVLALTRQPPHTLILEEPESALHPAAQRALLSLLQDWARDRLIMISTHSPVFLDWAPTRSAVYLVTRERGVSALQEVTSAPRDAYSALGVRLSDVLTAEAVLVEGPTDRDVLSVWFSDELLNPRLAVVPTAGGDAARHSRTMSQWFASADTVGARKIVFLRDRDELTDEEVASLSRGGAVHVLAVRELENYLLDADGLTTYFQGLSGGEWDIKLMLNEAIESQRQVVVLKRVLARLRLPRFIDNDLRRELSDSGAGREELRDALQKRLASREALDNLLDQVWNAEEVVVDSIWLDRRSAIVGGEDVLRTVFGSVLGRGYSKRHDGPELASLIPAPQELADLVGLMTSTEDQ